MHLKAWFQQFLDRCLPTETKRDKPWLGWLLKVSVILAALFLLFTFGLLVFLVDSFTRFGSGTLGGQADFTPGGAHDFNGGLGIARLWLVSLLSVVPLSVFRIWWLFSRSDRPRSVHGDMAAAQRGEPQAAHRVARHYRDRDPSAARSWLLRAAQGGSPQAMVDLARELQEGRGGPRDLGAARAWLQRAQAAGAPGAAELLEQVEAQLGDRFSERGQ
jgi:hypothetical protein